jgi:hypothetical protein
LEELPIESFLFIHEKNFTEASTTVFESFVVEPIMVKTGVTIFFPMFWECWLLFLYLETVVYLKLWSNWIAFIFSNMG